MDLFLAKIEDLKRHAELLSASKRNCRCVQGGQGSQTPLPASKRAKRDVASPSLPPPSLHVSSFCSALLGFALLLGVCIILLPLCLH